MSHNFNSICVNSLIRKTNIFACDRFHMHFRIGKFWFTCIKLITTIELQYYVNLRANFNLNKFGNLSIQFENQSIISIQSFFSVMGWKRPSNHFQSSECFIYVEIRLFCLIHKVDFCLANVNLQVSKWFATYPVINKHDKYRNVWRSNFAMILREAMREWLQPNVGLKTC